MNERKAKKRGKNGATRRMGSNQLEMFERNRLHVCVCALKYSEKWKHINGTAFGYETNLNKCSDTMVEECAKLPRVSACAISWHEFNNDILYIHWAGSRSRFIHLFVR